MKNYPNNRPFLDLKSNYVKKYFEQISDLVPDILNQDLTEISEYRVPAKYEYGDWRFRVIKSPKDGLQLNNFYSEKLKNIILDENIPTVSLNTFASNSEIKEHVDPPYYGKNLWRILVPITAEDSFITAESFGTIQVEVGKPFILDFIYDSHSGQNKSKNIDLSFWCFDILYENEREYLGNHPFEDPLYTKILNIDMSAYEKC